MGVVFEYVGSSSLIAIGSVTLRRYTFAAPGARVEVDRRDAASLREIASLRQAAQP